MNGISENNKRPPEGSSAVKRIKTRNALKRQRIATVALLVAVALLAVALAAVLYIVDIYSFTDADGTKYLLKKVDGAYALCYKSGDVADRDKDGYYLTDAGTQVKVDPKSGEYSVYAAVDTEGSEVLGYSQHVLMFKQLTYDISSTSDSSRVVKSIRVQNDFGEYEFRRVGSSGDFEIVGHEQTPFSKELFAQLSVACGYTISMYRLEDPVRLADGSIDYSEYGLVPETRKKPVEDENGVETEEEYAYEPIKYEITTMTDESYRVTVGDLTVTGTGYYAKLEGRDRIYVLASANLGATVCQPVEKLVSPMLIYPMQMNDYFDVTDFKIYDSIDHGAIYSALEEKYGEYGDELIENEELRESWQKDYTELFAANSHKVCDFSYQDLEERQNTMYSYIPYVSALEYADGYYINSTNIDTILYSMYETEFSGVVNLSPTDEDLEEYGLYYPEYMIEFIYNTENAEGKPLYVKNYVEVSKKTEHGTFYAYSEISVYEEEGEGLLEYSYSYDMIVEVAESSFAFLEWEELAFYDKNYIQLDISTVTDIIIESGDASVHFEIDDSASRYLTYFEQSGTSFKIGGKSYKVTRDASGKYVLTEDGGEKAPIYTGDYLVTPLIYTPGQAEAENYLFVETVPIDSNKDGETDVNAYYYYNVGFDGKDYCLIATIVLADTAGNKLGEQGPVMGEAYIETDFYLTNSSYLYLTDKDSYLGERIDEQYGQYKRGSWGHGNLFVTADGKYVLVNAGTGAWSILDDVSSGIYFADRHKDRLGQRAVVISTEYSSTGAITRYGETYYPKTHEKLMYDEEEGALMVYDSNRRTWERATYEDCTIGIWCTGAYYALDGGVLVAVNGESGDWGYVNVSANEIYVAEVIANGERLDYTVSQTEYDGDVKNITAMQNFQQFYKGLLYASIEGMAELGEDEKATLRELDDFGADGGVCQLKITVLGVDLYGNRRDTVYRFYQYTERKSYMTVASLDSPDDESVSSEAYGNFYVLRSFIDKIIEDAQKTVDGVLVEAVTKY